MEINWDEAPEGYPLWIVDTENRAAPDWHKDCDYYYIARDGSAWDKSSENKGRIIVHRRPEPVAWDGEGLPPVGAEFEYSANGIAWEERVMLFNDGISLLMANKKYPANRWHYKACDRELQFRPILTAEQKAAQERELAIDDMGSIYLEGAGGHKGGLAALYDAGYRKTVIE